MKFKQLILALQGDNYAKYYVLRKLKKLFGRHTDDFFWDIYNYHYRGEMADNLKHYSMFLRPGDYAFEGGRLEKKAADIKPLHPNLPSLYETILQLKPSSAIEFGCGNGVHLHNMSVLAPAIRLTGFDRSKEQLNYLKEIHPNLKADIRLLDISQPLAASDKISADICFSHAVIMHIKTGDGHRQALANMFSMASKQVVLVENWKHHEFMKDVLDLHGQRRILWKDLHLYYQVSRELQHPHVLICSSVQLDYPALTDYRILSDTVTSM